MSNFRSKAFNPASKRVEVAEYCDDYYGRHRYGIRFDDGCVHPEAQCGIDAAATQLDSLLKEREALKTELEIWQARATRLQQERDGIETQLPDGMRHCTITFHECEKGHGRLSATNWIDSGCLCCQRDEAYERAAKVCDAWPEQIHDVMENDGSPVSATSCAKSLADRIRRLAGPEKEKKE